MGFSTPIFLFLLTLTSLPLIIHLIQRIRLKRVSYSSLFFLTQTNRETFSWLQLKEILLLIFRTLFVFFLLFSLARPYLVKKIFSSKVEASRIIVLDDSYSMAYADNFARAKTEGQKLISELKKGSEVALLTSSGSIKTNLVTDFAQLTKIIDTIELSCSHKTLEHVFDIGLNLMNKAAYVKKEIFIITDLQSRAVQPLLSKIELTNQIFRYNITLIDVGTEGASNAGIEKIFTIPSLPSLDFPARLYVKINNYSDKTQKRTFSFSLKFSQQDTTIYRIQKDITLNPHETKTIAIDTTIGRPGIYKAEVLLNNDSLTADDRYFFGFNIKERNRILLIADNIQDIKFIEKALETSSFEITKIDVSAILKQNLKPYQSIGLFNPTKMNSLDWSRIAYYVKSGGGLFISLNQELQESQWTNILGIGFDAGGKSIRLNPSSFVSVEQVNYENPVMEIFKEISLTTPRFYSYWVLNKYPQSQVLAYFSSGNPFLIQAYNQKIILAFTSFDESSTDFMYKATFMPLVHRIFTYLSSPIIANNYYINDTIVLSVPAQNPLKIRTPSGEYLQTPHSQNSGFVITLNDTKQQGFYEIGDNVFSVNINQDEGNLTKISRAELKKYKINVIDKYNENNSDFTFISLLLALLFLTAELILLII